jgi:ADP-ribose pyrophosphatase YjhB (NUDIX family)
MTEYVDIFKQMSIKDADDNDGGEWVKPNKKKNIKLKKINIEEEPYSDLRGGVILKKENKYLLVRGQNTPDSEGKWGFPKGHLEKKDDDDLIKTALRELEEETEVIINYNAFDKKNYFRDGKVTLYYIDADAKKDLITIPKEFRKPNSEIKKMGWFSFAQMKESLSNHKYLDKINMSLTKWIKSKK